MSRRKQAKPKAFKPDLEPRAALLAMLPDEPTLLDEQDADIESNTAVALATSLGSATHTASVSIAVPMSFADGRGYNTMSSPIPEKQETNDSLESEALGTDEGSSWRSETPDDPTRSPAPSSCATPNSSTELPDAELSYTVGITEATPYACPFCEKAFPRLSFLKKHEQIHTDQMPFKCDFCTRLFKHKRSRDRHLKLHTGDRKYRCTLCDAAFSRSDHLKIHLKTHDTQKPFQCTTCNRGYNTAAALTSHMQTHKRQAENPSSNNTSNCASNNRLTASNSEESASSPASENFRCPECGECFRKPEMLQHHIISVHSSETFSLETSLSSNIPVSIAEQILPQLGTKLACIYCTKDSFTTMEQLQLHVQAMHSSILNGEFSLMQARQTATPSPHHLLTPPPALPLGNSSQVFSCELCIMRFSSLNRLQKHYLTVHRHSTNDQSSHPKLPDSLLQYPFPCGQCGLHFQNPAALAEHFVMMHRPQLLPDELKPTDLSRKTPRSTSSEERTLKRQCIAEDSGTPNINTTAAQYDYPGMYLCNQCDAALPDFESFRTHLKLHLEQQDGGLRSFLQPNANLLAALQQEGVQLLSNPCVCRICGREFKDIASCEQHIFSHFLTTATEYGCQSCRKMYPKPDELQKHLMDIHAHHLYRCSLCKEMFDSKVAIQVHFAVKHSNECKLFRCTACPNNAPLFHTELEFGIHIRTAHNAHGMLAAALKSHSKALRCTYCHQTFGSDLEMQFHLATHTKQFRCPLCSEIFQVEYLLDKHIQTYHNSARNLNGEADNSGDGEKTPKKSLSNSPVVQAQTPPSRVAQKPSSTENNNVKKQHETSEINNCDICERNDFSNETELVAHRKLVHHVRNSSKNGAVSLHCAYCNENCKTRTELENHMKSHSQSSGVSGKHKCNICDELCPSAILLAEHKLTHCKVISANCCTLCKSLINTEEQFYAHLLQHSNNNNGSNQKTKSQVALPTQCVICRQTLISEVEVRIHSQFHLRNTMQQPRDFPCAVCFKMVELQNVVMSKGSYVCSECYSLQNGSQARNNFHCAECQLTFESNKVLDQHIETIHQKTFTCIKCHTNFDTEREVQIHVTSHLMSEGNNHECHLCRRLFSSPMKLQSHLIEHTFAGCGSFTCYLCSAVFTGSQGLQGHIVEHGLAKRPYDCPQCNLKFFFRAELENHSFSHLSGSTRISDADITLMSPKAYYISTNEKYNSAKNGDATKTYTKDNLKKKKNKSNKETSEEAENLSQKPCSENINDATEIKTRVKDEPNDDSEESIKDEYIEVGSPINTANLKSEMSSSIDDHVHYDNSEN